MIFINIDFWDVKSEYRNDKFMLLANTQGMLPTDNFEFLADFELTPGFSLITEICGLSKNKFQSGFLSAGDLLRWEKEPVNEFDKFAVHIFKEEIAIGYIKHIHSKLFYQEEGKDLKVTVKSFDQN